MQKISSFTPSPPLPRKRRREQTEFAAPAEAQSLPVKAYSYVLEA